MRGETTSCSSRAGGLGTVPPTLRARGSFPQPKGRMCQARAAFRAGPAAGGTAMRAVPLVSLGMIAAAGLGACTCQGVRKPDPQVREVVPAQVLQGLRVPVLLNGS